MALVSNTLAIDKYVIIEILSGGVVKPNSTTCGFGIVLAIGPAVTQVSIGQYVFFVAEQKDIMFIKTNVIPP